METYLLECLGEDEACDTGTDDKDMCISHGEC